MGNVNADRAKIRRNAVSSNGQIGGLKKNWAWRFENPPFFLNRPSEIIP
jgi:hypothetical protein